MKKICVLSYERTGSTWLMDLFDSDRSVTLHEPCSDDPTLLYFNLLRIFNTNSINIDKSIVDTFSKIYNPNNFFIDPEVFKKIKLNMINSNPYSFEYLLGILNHFKNENKDYIVFKIFPSHLKNNITIEKIINISDFLIFNYRNNLFDTYISHRLAQLSGTWFKTNSFRQSNYDVTKLTWNVDNYLNYIHNVYKKFNFLKSNFDLSNKPKLLLSYEEIHKLTSFDDKRSYLMNLLKSQGINMDLSKKEKVLKQNTRKLDDIFTNADNVRSDLQNVNKYIYA